MDCLKCGSSDAGVIEVISNKPKEGIIWVCKKCADAESLVELRRPTSEKIKEIEVVTGRGMFKQKTDDFGKHSSTLNQDMSLRMIVEKNLSKRKSFSVERPNNLVRNFHWAIMRERQRKKITQLQMAHEIGEPVESISMIEKGALPDDWQNTISKIEAFLGIFLSSEDHYTNPFEAIKTRTISHIKDNPEEAFKDITDKFGSKVVTIGDLKKVQKEIEPEFSIEDDKKYFLFEKPVTKKSDIQQQLAKDDIRKKEFVRNALEGRNKGFGDDSAKQSFRQMHESRETEKKDSANQKELSEEEINRLIFGK